MTPPTPHPRTRRPGPPPSRRPRRPGRPAERPAPRAHPGRLPLLLLALAAILTPNRPATAEDAPNATNAANAAETPSKTRAIPMLLLELDDLKEKIREFDARLGQLNALRSQFEGASVALNQALLTAARRADTLPRAYKDLQAAVDAIAAAAQGVNRDVLINKARSAYYVFVDAFTFADQFRVYTAIPNADGVPETIPGNEPTAGGEPLPPSAMQALRPLIAPAPGESPATESQWKATADALRALSAQEILDRQSTFVERVRTALEDGKKKVQQVSATVTDRRNKAQAAIADINQELYRLSMGQSGTFTSVYSMMILLGGMFVLTVFARLWVTAKHPTVDGTAIINEKTIIEFGGMSFILLTIIILGNTEKLDRQALGTLLGTIAGYIFGKGIVENVVRSQRRHAGDTVPPPAPPPAAPRTIRTAAVTPDRTHVLLAGIGIAAATGAKVAVGQTEAKVSTVRGKPAPDPAGADELEITLDAPLPAHAKDVTVSIQMPGGGSAQWSGDLA